jgi:GMP synthase-like glutamine amidotransferase
MGLKEKVLIIQHSSSTPPGTVVDWLKLKNIDSQIFRADQGTRSESWPKVDDFSWLIVLGGGMNVDQEDLHPWLVLEKQFIREAIQKGRKVLGLCLGGQLIAEILGAKVHRHEQWEVGWHQVEIKNTEKLFQFSAPVLKAFQWHGYRFHLPEAATRIATNSACIDQGFIYGDRVVGLQFHPESTREWIIECVTDVTEDEPYPEGPYVQNATDVLAEINQQKTLQSWFYRLLENMCELSPT